MAPVNSTPVGKRLKRWFRFSVLRLAAYLVGCLPVSMAARMGRWAGRLVALVAISERRKAMDGLSQAFPLSSLGERKRLCNACFAHLGQTLFEMACVKQIDRSIDAHVVWPEPDRQVLTDALSRGRGVVFVSGHVGHWELLARRVALAGFHCQTIAKETSDPRLTQWVSAFRGSAGLRSIWRGQPGTAKHMLRALKNNGILGLLIDQDTKVQSVFVNFFGAPAKTPRAAADLAVKTGAALVVGFCQRQHDNVYHISMQEVAVPSKSESASAGLTQTLTSLIEAAIRRHPEQWVWMHRRWKSQP